MDIVGSLAAWTTEAGLAGESEAALLGGFCRRAREAGLPVTRATVVIDTLHPIHEGRAFRWRVGDAEEASMLEYGRTNEGEAAVAWRRSPFFHLLGTGGHLLRRRLVAGDPADFPALAELQGDGMTDYVALVTRFAAAGTIGEMDCVYSSWATDSPAGFGGTEVDALQRLVPTLALATKCASLARIAATIAEVYLGRDAGHRVLDGRIARGIADRISAVLWYSDLRGFTRITDTAPEQVIPLLNDYAGAVVSAVHEQGGDVLKLIGDGTLAIFRADDAPRAACCALTAASDLRRRVAGLNRRRAALGQPTTQPYVGLHVGDVFYGNIGSEDRLDFTVVGPAVNEVSRIAAMCGSAERDVLLSAALAALLPAAETARVVSVGRYALRGIERPEELFTLLPDAA
jgi:adenylate cyclase